MVRPSGRIWPRRKRSRRESRLAAMNGGEALVGAPFEVAVVGVAAIRVIAVDAEPEHGSA